MGRWVADYLEWRGEQRIMSIVLALILLVLLSFFNSCQDLRYMISGKVIDAPMTTRVDTIVRDGQRLQERTVGYRYQDGDQSREAYVHEPLDWPGVGQATVKVQYIPGRDISRVYGETNKVWVIILCVSVALTIIGVVIMGRQK